MSVHTAVKLCSGFALLILSVLATAEQAQIVTNEDGRQVQLNADGSWSYVQRDRYATNQKGERFVLSPNGQWRRLLPENTQPGGGNNESRKVLDPQSAIRAVTADQPVADPVKISLAQVTVKRSRTKALKSVRTDSETHFVFRLHNLSGEPLAISEFDSERFRAETSRGRALKVQRVDAAQSVIQPGQQGDITVICSGSPRWKSVDYLRLIVQPNALGNLRPHILDRSLRDVEFTQVKSL